MHSFLTVLPISSFILCIGLGLFTLSRNPHHIANIGFALGLACLAVIEAGGVLSSYGNLRVGLQISAIGQALLPAAWMLFSVVFGRANFNEILRRWLPAIILMASVSLYLIYLALSGEIFFPLYLRSDMFNSQSNVIPISAAGRYLYVYLTVGLVLNLIHLETTFRSSFGVKRWQIKYLMLGVGAILSYFIYLSSQVLLFSAISIFLIPTTSAVIIVSVMMMTLFIVKNRLLDVDIFVSRYVVYNSVTVFIVGLYLLGVGSIAQIITYFELPISYFLVTFFVFLSMLMLFLLFFSTRLRRKLQLFVSRHFYKHKYEFRDKWMETMDRISSKRSVVEVCETLVDMIKDTMCAASAEVWLHQPGADIYRSPQRDGCEISLRNSLVSRISAEMAPFDLDDRDTADPGFVKYGEKFKPVLCAPLIVGSELTGFMLIGKDLSGERYREDDFQLLTAVTTQAAVQIKNLRLSQELTKAKEVEAFHRMSSFIMHDLKNLTNSLSLVSQNSKHHISNPEFQQDAVRTIDSTVSRMKGLIERLSKVPTELDVRRIRTNARDMVVRAAINAGVSDSPKICFINRVCENIFIDVDPEALEMVFLNLLKNGAEAIKDRGDIHVQTMESDEWLDISVIDNGLGMSKEFIEGSLFQPFKSTKKGGFGIGLYQCKAVVEAHGGKVSVESEEGMGTKFTIRLPK